MQYSLITVLAAAFAVNVMAAPAPAVNNSPDSCPSGPATSTAPAPVTSTTPAPVTSTTPTPTLPVPTSSAPAPTGTGACGPAYPADCTFTCTQPATIELLNCVNVLTGLGVSIPINAVTPIPSKRQVAKRTDAADKNYCCKPGGLLVSALTCVDIASGSSISVPINLLNGS